MIQIFFQFQINIFYGVKKIFVYNSQTWNTTLVCTVSIYAVSLHKKTYCYLQTALWLYVKWSVNSKLSCDWSIHWPIEIHCNGFWNKLCATFRWRVEYFCSFGIEFTLVQSNWVCNLENKVTYTKDGGSRLFYCKFCTNLISSLSLEEATVACFASILGRWKLQFLKSLPRITFPKPQYFIKTSSISFGPHTMHVIIKNPF